MLVVDASLVASGLVDAGPVGRWAESLLASGPLVAPHLLPAEVANILRRASTTGELSADSASLAHRDLLDLRIELYPYEAVAPRVWSLRHNVTAHDAWYVGLAELLDAPLATLDTRLARTPGPHCTFLTPPTS